MIELGAIPSSGQDVTKGQRRRIAIGTLETEWRQEVMFIILLSMNLYRCGSQFPSTVVNMNVFLNVPGHESELIKEANEDRTRRDEMTPEERRNAIYCTALKVLDDFLATPDLDRTLYCYHGRIADWRVRQQSLPLLLNN